MKLMFNTINIKHYFIKALDVFIILLFFLNCLSIPLFSFITAYAFVTWIFTIPFLVAVVLSLVVKREIKIDFVCLALFLFCISALISTLLNGFKGTRITPILLTVITLIVYLFLINHKEKIPFFIGAFVLAINIFVIIFFLRYFKEIFSFDFYRLGAVFGDENDIGIFLSFAAISDLFICFFAKRKFFYIGIMAAILFAISSLAGAATGSKMVVLLLAVGCLLVPILRFKNKVWIGVLIDCSIIIILLILISTPFLSTIRDRLLKFISTLFGEETTGVNSIDGSTIDRTNMILCSFQMFLRKPLFGYGLDGFELFNGFNNYWSHNNLGEFLTNFGIIGTLLFHAPFIFSILSVKKTKKDFFTLYSYAIIILFIVTMFSVAFTREKIYSYFAPVIFACTIDDSESRIFNIKLSLKNFLKKTNNSLI